LLHQIRFELPQAGGGDLVDGLLKIIGLTWWLASQDLFAYLNVSVCEYLWQAGGGALVGSPAEHPRPRLVAGGRECARFGRPAAAATNWLSARGG